MGKKQNSNPFDNMNGMGGSDPFSGSDSWGQKNNGDSWGNQSSFGNAQPGQDPWGSQSSFGYTQSGNNQWDSQGFSGSQNGQNGFDTSGLQYAQRTYRKKKSPIGKILAGLALAIALLLGLRFIFGGGAGEETVPPSPTKPVIDSAPVSVPTVETTAPAPTVSTQPTAQTEKLRYYGQLLDETQQGWYCLLVDQLLQYADEITIDISKAEASDEKALASVLEETWYSVVDDYAEIFWAHGYEYLYYAEEDHWPVTLKPHYIGTRNEIEQKKQFIENAAGNFLEQHRNDSEADKIFAVTNFLIDETAYDYDYVGTTIYELFKDHRAVCENYARGTQYLLTKLGVESIYVSGDAVNSAGVRESHAWNIVKLNGTYCQLDVTWGDPLMPDGEQTKTWAYYLISDDEMYLDHFPEQKVLPACRTDQYDYYHAYGLFLNDYDKDLIAAEIRKHNGQDNTIHIKAANPAVYQQLVRELVDNSQFWDIFERLYGKSPQYSYSQNETMRILNISW